MIPREPSLETRQVHDKYCRTFNVDESPLGYVGFARIYKALESNVPVPRKEYKKRENGKEETPLSCKARTSEEEQAIIEYERMFKEELPRLFTFYFNETRIARAVAEGKPIPLSEYECYVNELLPLE